MLYIMSKKGDRISELKDLELVPSEFDNVTVMVNGNDFGQYEASKTVDLMRRIVSKVNFPEGGETRNDYIIKLPNI